MKTLAMSPRQAKRAEQAAADAVHEIVYGRTPIGQLVYDLAFTDLSDRYLAGKHHLPVAKIRELRNNPEMAKLRTKVKNEHQPKRGQS
jgi:hypothetical protein